MARLKELTELDASGYVPAETYLLAEDSSEESQKVKASTLLSGVTADMGALQTTVGDSSGGLVKDVSDNATAIGTLSNLETTEKGSLVGAVNEIKSGVSTNATAIGDLVAAINEVAQSGGGGGANPLIETTWSALKTLRDGGNLVPGQQYRITDYVTTTVQPETQSAGHQFDIIVTADSEGVLNENARAAIHAGDTYFADSKLQAWKLKYCLDNDTARFAWADTTNGKGVIYQMTDEFENDLPYDFKSIQFKRYKITAKTTATKPDDLLNGYYRCRSSVNPASTTGVLYPSDYTISTDDTVFRFTFDYNGSDYSLNKYDTKSGTEWKKNCYGNEIAPYYYQQKQGLNNIVFLNTSVSSANYGNRLTGAGTFSNTFGNFCQSNTFGDYCRSNTFANPDGIRFFKMDSIFYFDDGDSSDYKLQFINNGNSSVTVTGQYWAGEYEDRETSTPASVNVTVLAGTTATIFSYDDSDYDDGYSYWNLSATVGGRVVNNSGEYD